jgi:hypothetical protein
MTPYDKIGREIKVGDFIAYGHALGRCAALAIGKVLAIKYGPAKGYSSHMQWSITVWGVDDGWNGKKLNSTKGTLQFPDRIIVVDTVPDEYKKLLDPLTAESKSVRVKGQFGWSSMKPPTPEDK